MLFMAVKCIKLVSVFYCCTVFTIKNNPQYTDIKSMLFLIMGSITMCLVHINVVDVLGFSLKAECSYCADLIDKNLLGPLASVSGA